MIKPEYEFDAKLVKLEAQCAAMRGALEYAKLQVISLHPGHDPRGDQDADQVQIEVLDTIDDALSLGAGEKVLDVVRAVEEHCADLERLATRDKVGPGYYKLKSALTALGWKS